MLSLSPEANPASEAPGVRVRLAERFTLHTRLGEGSSGTVWEATERATGRTVALKRLRAGVVGDRGRVAERFVAEARALARLEHPHLVRIEAVLTEDTGTPCLVMERLRGQTLAQHLAAQATLTPEDAYRLLVPLMGALATAHDAGVIHRDVKPANLFLREHDGGTLPWPVLLDFGAAKLDDGEGKATTSGMTVGTPCYMAPEQAQGLELGPHTDVWAMGVVWYRCLTGALPFDAETSLGVVIKLSRERAPRLADVLPELPMPLAVALDRALEPAAEARYPDMRAFARALANAAAQAGLEVERNPDTRALPDFPRWLDEADAECTAALPCVTASQNHDVQVHSAMAAEATVDTGHAIPTDGTREALDASGRRRGTWIAALVLLAAGATALGWSRGPWAHSPEGARIETDTDGSDVPTAALEVPASAYSSQARAPGASRRPAAPGARAALTGARASERMDTPAPNPNGEGAPVRPESFEHPPFEATAAPTRAASSSARRAQRPRSSRGHTGRPKRVRARSLQAAGRPAREATTERAAAPEPPAQALEPGQRQDSAEEPGETPASPRVIEDFNW